MNRVGIWIHCAVNPRRRWPSQAAQSLVDCGSCGGVIDLRNQASMERSDGLRLHYPGTCPEPPQVAELATVSGDQ